MSETRQDFKDAADWEKKYSPLKRGNGIRVRNNGTLFDRHGEDRKFVNRMEREFIWSVCHNGYFEYVQAGIHNDSNVIGYLVTDNPVLFADLNSKFAIGFPMIDWNTFERCGEPEVTSEANLDIGHVTSAAPEFETPAKQHAASVQKIETEPARAEIVSGGKEKKTKAPSPDKKKDRTPNSVKRLVGSFRRKISEKQQIPPSKAVEELSAAPMAAPKRPDSPEPTPAPIAAPLSRDIPSKIPSATTTAPASIPAATAAPLSLGIPATITPPPAQKPAPVRPAPVPRPKPRFARPKPAPLPFPLLAPPSTAAPDPLPTPKPVQVIVASSISLKPKSVIPPAAPPAPTPAADPLPLLDTSTAAMAVQVRVRYLPFGTDAAKLDRQVYGPWPNAAGCKDCGGTGYFSGVVVGLIPCDECEGRGWNPPPGAPTEIVVSAK